MPMHQEFFNPLFLLEIVYSLLVIIPCLVVYLKTREMQNLTGHRGLRYFSLTFLCFAIAYIFRFIFKVLITFFAISFKLHISPQQVMNFGNAIYYYSSVLAAFYLLYSVIWKYFEKRDISSWLHAFSFVIVLIELFSRSAFFRIIILLILLVSVLILGYKKVFAKKKKHLSGFFISYVLILLFWALDVLSFEIPFFMRELKLVLYIISSLLFIIIMIRVLMKAR